MMMCIATWPLLLISSCRAPALFEIVQIRAVYSVVMSCPCPQVSCYQFAVLYPLIDSLGMDLKFFNALKQTDFPWMYECSKAAPQEALRDLDNAFSHFFRRCQMKKEGKWEGKIGYPQFKTKRRGLGSFRLTGSIHVYEKAIDLPRLGRLRLKECGYLPTSGVQILSATVSEEAGRWFVSLQVREEGSDPPKAAGEPIGIDLGINTMANCSDGHAIE